MICLTHRKLSFTDDPSHLKSNHNDIKTTKQTEKNQVHSEPSEFQIALESLGPKSSVGAEALGAEAQTVPPNVAPF
jgi:hypothetical protein